VQEYLSDFPPRDERSSGDGSSEEAFHNPLPSGMRDLLPPKAAEQSRVGSRVMKSFETYGYGRVWLPLFEYARILERTSSSVGSALRFVEPESGEVVALRSDMTPQIARLVSTRYANAPRPVRLCYQGSVLRRRQERARTESQVVQAGVELVGKGGLDGDFEVIEVLSAAIGTTGLSRAVLDLGHAAIAQSLLAGVAGSARPGLMEALSAKDSVELSRRAKSAGLSTQETRAFVALTELHGDGAVWQEAERVLGGTPAHAAVVELRALYERVVEAGLFSEVVVDLGEVRGFNYYTGPLFHVLAFGPGEPIASGGRYDTLLPRFGLPNTPSAGFAVDINNLCWALETQGVKRTGPLRVACSPEVARESVRALRAKGVAVSVAESDVATFAKAHHFDFIVTSSDVRRVDGAVLLDGLRDPGGETPERWADQVWVALTKPSER
jgi:ATP phosphoribosyltransferase regulatory subunit